MLLNINLLLLWFLLISLWKIIWLCSLLTLAFWMCIVCEKVESKGRTTYNEVSHLSILLLFGFLFSICFAVLCMESTLFCNMRQQWWCLQLCSFWDNISLNFSLSKCQMSNRLADALHCKSTWYPYHFTDVPYQEWIIEWHPANCPPF